MNGENMETIQTALCAQLDCIASGIRDNGGKFSSGRMLDDAKDCLQALKDMKKIYSVASKHM